MAKQEFRESMPGAQEIGADVLPAAEEVRFDAIATPARDQGGGNHVAAIARAYRIAIAVLTSLRCASKAPRDEIDWRSTA